jgi:peptidoglycan/xylan/chitin deacetylase (PgdA/CDA1 family)
MRGYWRAWRGIPGADACDDFDLLMDQAERWSLKMTFNFITEHGAGGQDGIYSVDRVGIRRLLRRICERGHEIGYHGSYESFQDPVRIRREFNRLIRIADRASLTQPHWSGRQHYLRWEAPTTWQAYDDAGLAYDSSVGYADHVGFRCGTCYEFPVFNLVTHKELSLKERPLIVMECSMSNPQYMNLSEEASMERLVRLSETCKKFGGDFSFLWHNGQTGDPGMKTFFREALRATSGGDA